MDMPRRVALEISDELGPINQGWVTPVELDEDYAPFAGWSVVRTSEFAGTRRWGNIYSFVMQSPDGKYWIGDYTIADEGAGGSYSDEPVELHEVRRVETTQVVVTYEAV